MKRTVKLMALIMGLTLIFTTAGVAATFEFARLPSNPSSKKLPLRMYSWIEIPDQEIDIVNRFLEILNNIFRKY